MTSERGRTLWLLLGALAALNVGACTWLGGEDGTPQVHELPFNHKVHIETAHLRCEDCHKAGAEGEPTLPQLDFCGDCHDEFEENQKILDYLAKVKARPAEQRWVIYTVQDPEVKFSHVAHVSSNAVACDACHGDVANSTATGPWVVPKMGTCVDCHRESEQASTDCATCHVRRRRDVPPKDHRQGWEWEHGKLARHGDLDTLLSGRCSYCHQRDTCVECHRNVQPRSHTNFFRLRGHGLDASNDRSQCAVCHKPDMCVRCHESTRPDSHRGPFASPQNTHCLECHLPLQDESCSVCHKQTPSHALAPPKSPRHPNTGLNCRQCHGTTAAMPHADNGTNCNLCHQ